MNNLAANFQIVKIYYVTKVKKRLKKSKLILIRMDLTKKK